VNHTHRAKTAQFRDPANQLTNITRDGVLTVSGNTQSPASCIAVNGLPAETYADFTFASLNGYTLADGQNSFTNVATNCYGTATLTNIVTANLPASVVLQYDANGNLTNDGARSFSYDAENQLTNVMVAGQWREDFLYDGLCRRRIRREYRWNSGAWALTNETRFVYDGNAVARELDTNGIAQVTYTRGLGGLLARTDSAGSAYYHADGNKNITALINANQYVVARYLYDPFGRVLGKWGALADVNSRQFSGEELDSRANLYFCSRRFYDPTLQRWLSRDPIAEAGGINLYAYGRNNPVSFYDSSGLCPGDFWDLFWSGVRSDIGGIFSRAEQTLLIGDDIVGYGGASLFGYGQDFRGYSDLFQSIAANPTAYDPDQMRANIILGTFNGEANVATLGILGLAEGSYHAATTGDFSSLQDNFAAMLVGAGLYRAFGPAAETATAAKGPIQVTEANIAKALASRRGFVACRRALC
jgi:RHS repeat-associated protein